MNQLWERQRELETTRLYLEEERAALKHEITQHHDEVRA
jgi:hypothetical protein